MTSWHSTANEPLYSSAFPGKAQTLPISKSTEVVNGSLDAVAGHGKHRDVFPAGPRVGRVGFPCLSEEILPAGERISSVNQVWGSVSNATLISQQLHMRP